MFVFSNQNYVCVVYYVECALNCGKDGVAMFLLLCSYIFQWSMSNGVYILKEKRGKRVWGYMRRVGVVR